MYESNKKSSLSDALASRRGKGLYHHLVHPGEGEAYAKSNMPGKEESDLAPEHSEGAGGEAQHPGEDYGLQAKPGEHPEMHDIDDPHAMNRPMTNNPASGHPLEGDLGSHSKLRGPGNHFQANRGQHPAEYEIQAAPKLGAIDRGHVPQGTVPAQGGGDMDEMDEDMVGGMSEHEKGQLSKRPARSLSEHARKGAMGRMKGKGKY